MNTSTSRSMMVRFRNLKFCTKILLLGIGAARVRASLKPDSHTVVSEPFVAVSGYGDRSFDPRATIAD